MTPDSVVLFGIAFSRVSFDELCLYIDQRIADRVPGYIVTPNVDHVVRFHRDPAFRKAYEHAFLVLTDGMPILWTAWLLGRPVPEKLSGSDMVPRLSAYAADRGYSVFFFGASDGVAAEAASRMKGRYPNLSVAGVYSPPMGFEKDPAAVSEAIGRLRRAGADICFVALGSPKQEVWLCEHCNECGISVMIGVGAGLDFVSGRVRRAPRWMQYAGLEWIWRLVQEPRRLWHRYLVEDMYFFVLVWREIWQQWRRSPAL